MQRTKLDTPIDMGEILSGKLCEFKINTGSDEEDLDLGSEDFDEDFVYISRDVVINDSIDFEAPFSTLKLKMHAIDHGIFKHVHTEGTGPCVPETARIQVDYKTYLEGNGVPIEDTWINRRSPHTMNVQDAVLPGLYQALLSMKAGETASFVIPSRLLYGRLGMADYVPPNADMLYFIHLISFVDVGDSGLINDEYINQFDAYVSVVQRVAEVRKSAKTFFAEKKYNLALHDFKKCETALKFCRDPNVAERDEILDQLYVNICVCYNKLDRAKDVLEAIGQMQGREEKNCKALFQLGRAHFRLGNYEDATRHLNKALKLEPNNKEVALELKAINEAALKYKKDVKNISRKAMRTPKTVTGPIKAEDKESYELLRAFVSDFMATETNKQALPISLSDSELQIVQDLAEQNNLVVESRLVNNEKWRYLVKPEQTEMD